MLPLRHSVRMSVSSEDNISLANILLGAKNAPNFGPKSNFASWERHCALQFWDQESTVASFSFPFRSFSFPSTHSYGLAGGPGPRIHCCSLFLSFSFPSTHSYVLAGGLGPRIHCCILFLSFTHSYVLAGGLGPRIHCCILFLSFSFPSTHSYVLAGGPGNDSGTPKTKPVVLFHQTERNLEAAQYQAAAPSRLVGLLVSRLGAEKGPVVGQ